MHVHWPKWNVLSSLRPAHPPRGTLQQQPPTETQIQAEPDEEILGSDDEEQEDPNDYCKGGIHGFIHPFWQQKSQLDYFRWDLKAKKTIGSSLIHSCFFLLYLLAKLKYLPRSAAHNYCKLQKKCTVNTGMSFFLYICVYTPMVGCFWYLCFFVFFLYLI